MNIRSEVDNPQTIIDQSVDNVITQWSQLPHYLKTQKVLSALIIVDAARLKTLYPIAFMILGESGERGLILKIRNTIDQLRLEFIQ